MTIPPLGPPLPDESLRKRSQLPLKPDAVTLIGRIVRLEPLMPERDAATLFEVSNGTPVAIGDRRIGAYDADALVWRFMFDGPFGSAEELEAVLRQRTSPPNLLCFCAFDVGSNRPIGVASLMNNSPADLKIELGGIWYTPAVHGTPVNTEATYLMLRHVFDLGYRRAEWKCHVDNERSRRTALRMGFTFEGIQESHMIVKNRNRDTAWYRILDREWPEVRARLEGMLTSFTS